MDSSKSQPFDSFKAKKILNKNSKPASSSSSSSMSAQTLAPPPDQNPWDSKTPEKPTPAPRRSAGRMDPTVSSARKQIASWPSESPVGKSKNVKGGTVKLPEKAPGKALSYYRFFRVICRAIILTSKHLALDGEKQRHLPFLTADDEHHERAPELVDQRRPTHLLPNLPLGLRRCRCRCHQTSKKQTPSHPPLFWSATALDWVLHYCSMAKSEINYLCRSVGDARTTNSWQLGSTAVKTSGGSYRSTATS
ncbi:hypothetical protein L1049_010966 [Liquidambar formosana]|uniref:Uncharacterized protein n=1 Tax=Liquidambar formosana TaxID=63359 RepID=A0AAP0X281_LIQFO